VSVADNRISAVTRNEMAVRALRTRAHLAAWRVAAHEVRVPPGERRLAPAQVDAIADAALDATLELLARWEADRVPDEPAQPAQDGVRVVRWWLRGRKALRRLLGP
jgi:hypothetical protein